MEASFSTGWSVKKGAMSDEIDYVLPEPGVELNETASGVEYELPDVRMDSPYLPQIDEGGVGYQMPPVADSVVDFPYIANEAVEEAPYEELLTLMRRSKALLEQAQSRRGKPQPSAQPAPVQPKQAPQPTPPPPVKPAEEQPVQVSAVMEPIPLLPTQQYEQKAMSALAAMKAALGEGV